MIIHALPSHGQKDDGRLSLLVRNDAKSQMPCNIHYLRSKFKNVVKFLEVNFSVMYIRILKLSFKMFRL